MDNQDVQRNLAQIRLAVNELVAGGCTFEATSWGLLVGHPVAGVMVLNAVTWLQSTGTPNEDPT